MKGVELAVGRQTDFVIYGGGEQGNICYKNLLESGCHVVAAIDGKRSGEGIVGGIYTYKTEDFPIEQYDEENIVVVICLADGLLHREIADMLYRLGFLYIVFLPLGYCMIDLEKRRLTRVYNEILEGMMEPQIIIKGYQYYYQKDLNVENAILISTKKQYTVWLGEELLFTESLALWEGDKSKIHEKDSIKDKSILFNDPQEALMAFFESKKDDYEEYFSAYKGEKSFAQKTQELAKRERLFRLFKQEHNKGMDFFIESAPHVVWNPRNYFNLVGGHHRTMFLLNEGHTIFPVVISKEDFEKWCNREVYHEFLEYLKEHQIERLYAPLPHPGMLNFSAECENFAETKLKCIVSFFARESVLPSEILDCSRGQGYFARNMERIGVQKAIYIDETSVNVELANLMDRLLYRDRVIAKCMGLEDLSSDEKYDAVFAMDKFESIADGQSSEKLGILSRITLKYLFWETSIPSETEYVLENSDFSGFIMLHREYRAGRKWDMGVFYKD